MTPAVFVCEARPLVLDRCRKAADSRHLTPRVSGRLTAPNDTAGTIVVSRCCPTRRIRCANTLSLTRSLINDGISSIRHDG